MPEGHKTHFLAREHTTLLAGQALRVTSPQGRFRDEAQRIDGSRLRSATAVGKQLFYEFENGWHWQVHLGRYGKFKQHAAPPPRPVGQVRARVSGRRVTLDLSGPTTCRVIDAETRARVEAKIGPDPLAGGSAAVAWQRFHATRRPVAAVLLDQSVIAGLGNIFRAEILFELRFDPLRPADSLSADEFRKLWRGIGRMMRKGLRYGRIITVSRREAGLPLEKLHGNERFRVYGRDQCPNCGADIAKEKIGGRPLYHCPNCQSLSE